MRLRPYAYDLIVLALSVVLALAVFHQSATSLVEQDAASGGPMRNAAIYPSIVAWVIVGLAAAALLRILLGRLEDQSPIAPTATTRLALISTALFLAYLLLLRPVGFYLLTPVLLLALLRLYGISILAAAAGALGMTLAVAAVFEGALNVVLPLGFLEFTLFG